MPEAARGGKRPQSSRLDLATVVGLALAVTGVLGGLILEGGHIRDVAQITAAVIVLGGTIGAVMTSTPPSVLLRAARKINLVFTDKAPPVESAIEDIIRLATKARKHGIVSLEQDANAIGDDFLRKALNLAVDGTDLNDIRDMMGLQISTEEYRAEAEAKVYEAAGGYAPTIGIIGAVLGLIQVMKHLENIDEVGRGIAVAFVATVYGVALANLFFLPAANKLRARMHHSIQTRELMLEGVAAIVEGLNPKLIRAKLETYAREVASPAAKVGRRGERTSPAGLQAEG